MDELKDKTVMLVMRNAPCVEEDRNFRKHSKVCLEECSAKTISASGRQIEKSPRVQDQEIFGTSCLVSTKTGQSFT